MIKIKEEIFFSEIGKRENNEDNGGWNSQYIYVVCDGVGGHSKGEIASEIVVKTFLNFNTADELTPISKTLETAESRISDYILENPDSKGMGTTLSLIQIQENGINVSWVGDSRIYQFRNGDIVFQSRDHSWVNEALDAGIINEQEAINHPKSNIITRAIQGGHNPTKAQEKFLTDIQVNDCFFLCSDGILETWSNEDLCALFTSNNNLSEIAEILKKECAQSSRDNHTAILVKIEAVEINKTANIINTELDDEIDNSNNIKDSETISKEGFIKSKLFLASMFIVVIIIGIFIFKSNSNESDKNQDLKTPNTNKTKKQVPPAPIKPIVPAESTDDRTIENQSTNSSQEEEKILIEKKIDSLKNGESIHLNDLLESDSEKLLFNAKLRYTTSEGWEYQAKGSSEWKKIISQIDDCNKKFPGVSKEKKENKNQNTVNIET